ncbi:MAG: hypothetical protein WA947_08190 [Phormidesmis sp.]
MKKPNLRKLDLEDSPPPESTFRQGLLLGITIAGIPFLLVLVWFVHRPVAPSDGQRSPTPIEAPANRQEGN